MPVSDVDLANAMERRAWQPDEVRRIAAGVVKRINASSPALHFVLVDVLRADRHSGESQDVYSIGAIVTDLARNFTRELTIDAVKTSDGVYVRGLRMASSAPPGETGISSTKGADKEESFAEFVPPI